MAKAFLTTAEVAQRYAVGRTTVWRWERDGHLPAPVKIGAAKRWSIDQLNDHDARIIAAANGAST